jgi:ABC-type transporter Mla subunit MlaD
MVGGAIAGALLLLIAILLTLTWRELRTSREHIESQDAKVTALLRTTRPALKDVPQAVDAAKPLIRQAAPLVGRVLSASSGIADSTSRLPTVLAGLQGLINEGIPLAQGLRSSDLPGLVEGLRTADLPALVEALSSSGIPATVASAQELLDALASGDRLTGTLDQASLLFDQVEARRLPDRAVATAHRIRALLGVQRRAAKILRRSFGVQRRTLSHARSIDEKLGGELPPTVVP